ncbi:MAG: PAS-domain containing protein [Hyphomicrobiales bacterium]
MAGKPAEGSEAAKRENQRGASPTLDEARVELAFVERCEKALEHLSAAPDGTRADRDTIAIQALLEGTGFGAAGVARFANDRSTVTITFQNMHQMLLETTELDVGDVACAGAILRGDAVGIPERASEDNGADALVAALAAECFFAEPVFDGTNETGGFLFVANDRPAPSALTTVKTFFASVAAWLGADMPGQSAGMDEQATGRDAAEGKRDMPDQQTDLPSDAPGSGGLGIMVFDPALKLLTVNDRVRALADLPEAALRAGAGMDDVIGHLAQEDKAGGSDDRATELRAAVADKGSHEIVRHLPDGRTVACAASPMESGGYVITFSDVTENERRKHEVAEQAALLEATVEHMDHGLFAVDSELNVVFASERTKTTLGVPPEYFEPGNGFESMVRHCADQGAFGDGDPDAAAERILDDAKGAQPFCYEQICPGDWATLVRAHPRPNGGFVFTFSDITEAKQRQEELKDLSAALQERTEELRQKSVQLDKLFNNMSSGVAMFDAEQRLVICNPQYQEFFQLPDEYVQAGTRLADILHYCIAQGYEGDADTVLKERLDVARSRERCTFNMNMADGRVMHAIHEPVEDGGSIAVYEDITEREEAARRLREYAERIEHQKDTLQTVMEHMDQGISLADGDLRIQAFNRRFLELLEFPEGEFDEGDPVDKFFRYNAERGEYGPGDVEEQVKERVELARKHEPHNFVRERPDGTMIEIVGKPLKGSSGFVTTYTDVTETRKHEREVEALTERLTEANRRLDAAFNSMHQGLAMFDSDHKLVVRNKRYLEIFDFPEEVAGVGKSLEDITRYSVERGNEADPEKAVAQRMEIASRRERAVYHRNMADGRVLEIIHEPLAGGGSIALYLDVTDRINAERSLKEHAAQLEASNRELQDFAYVASHDLQEPLRKIEAFGDRLHKKCGDRLGEDGRLYVNRMQDSSRRLRALINDLLDYSRVTTKAKPFQQVDLNAAARHVLSDLGNSIERAGATVEVGDLPSIAADEVQMRQLLLNLMTNALKFRKEDVPPEIRIDAEVVREANEKGSMSSKCVLSVRDNGIGFDNKYGDRIFTIFQRLHGRTEYEGTGIGLATCRKIAERHHGTIDAEGELGEGAVFHVTLPVVQAAFGPPSGEGDVIEI